MDKDFTNVLLAVLSATFLLGFFTHWFLHGFFYSHGSPTPSFVCPAPGLFEREVLDCLGRDGVVLDTGSGAECVVWSHEIVKNRTKIGGGRNVS